MRTKNLNLKKKIAFIASVAMIATTAAYLPAGVFTTSASTVSTFANYSADGTFAAATSTQNKIETFSALVKVDGKYLAKNASGEYKTFSTVSAAENESYNVLDAATVIGAATAKTDPFEDDGTPEAKSAFYDVIGNTQLNIPYISTANPTIELEFVAKKDCIKSARSLDSVEVQLNDNGVGKVGKQTDYVVFQSNNSDYKESKGNTPQSGAYEIFDVSGLVIKMDTSDSKNESISGTKITKLDTAAKTIAVAKNDSDAAVVDTDGFFLDEADETPLTYEVKKVGGVYAKVMTGTLDTVLDPGAQIEVTLGAYATWTATGATNDKVTLTMGENGYAESGLVTLTQGSKKEYFVFVFKNKATGNETAEEAVTLAGKVQTTATAISGLGATSNTTNFRVESEVKTYRFEDTGLSGNNANEKERYVTEYTVYNNERSDDYDSSVPEYFTIDSGITAANNVGFSLPTEPKNGSTAISATGTNVDDGLDTTLEDVLAAADGVKYAETVKVKKTGAGTAESAILKLTSSSGTSYVKFVFKNSYKIKFNDGNVDTNENKSYDGYVEVTDGTKITAPADAEKKGFEFQGWQIGATDVFLASEGSDQLDLSTATVTPNKGLTAKYDGLRYNIAVHAGDGIIDPTNAGNMTNFSGSNYKTYDQVSGCYGDGTFTSIQRLANDHDLDTQVIGTGKLGAKRYGYAFKGWALTENASKPATLKELKAAFPGEGKTLDLYAVYKAAEDINVQWGSFDYDALTGNLKTITGKQTKVDALSASGNNEDNWLDATAPSWNKASDGVKTVTVGEKIGELPTPVKKGYTFDGWFVKSVDKLGNITATQVTADTVFDEKIFKVSNGIEKLDGSGDDSAVTSANYGKIVANTTDAVSLKLYAKFTPHEYTITFDLGDGSWNGVTKYDDADSDKPVSYKIINDVLKLYKADGTISGNGFVYEPIVGSGEYTEFRGWKINGGATVYQTSGLENAILNQKNAADITITAVYQSKTNSNAAISIDANGGNVYYALFKNATDDTVKGFYNNDEDLANDTNADGLADNTKTATAKNPAVNANDPIFADNDYENLDTAAKLQASTPATAVTKDFIVNGSTVRRVANKLQGFVVSRPGYTFTGWYTDKACTKPYTFGNFPAKGNEDVVYAGWKANSATKYQIEFELINADGSVYAKNENDGLVAIDLNTGNVAKNPHDLSFVKTYNGTTGEVVNAADKTIQTLGANAKTYVYSKNLSEGRGLTTSDKVNAEYSVAKLQAGSFVVDSAEYTIIEGVYVEEGTENTELGKATNVKGTANGKKVTISFTAADNAVKYQVCKIVNGKKYYTAKTDATSIDISPATVDYQVYVIAFDKDGKSTHSETIKLAGVPKSTLGTVKNPKVTESLEGDKKIGTVTWDAVEGATWYKVFKVVNGKTYWGSKVTENKYVFKDLPKDSSYIIYVAAGDDKGNVTYGARTKISKYPAVQNVKISADKKTVTFDKAEGAVNYQVAKLINGKTYYGTKSTSNSITMENAAKSGTQIFVLAFFTGDDGKTYSSYSQSITVE